jgi:hypothetical protein
VQFRIIVRTLTAVADTEIEIAIANRVLAPRRATTSERFEWASIRNVIGGRKASVGGEGSVDS